MNTGVRMVLLIFGVFALFIVMMWMLTGVVIL